MTTLTDKLLRATVEAYEKHNCMVRPAAQALGIGRATVRRHITVARERGIYVDNDAEVLREKIRLLTAEIKQIQHENLEAVEVREQIFELSRLQPKPPEWSLKPQRDADGPGVPVLCLADWHWGEVVSLDAMDSYNAFNIRIGNERVKTTLDKTLLIAKKCLAHKKKYPGIVVPLLGDMLSGSIHEELTTTNELPIMAAFADVFSVLCKVLTTLADEFGNVFAPCVPGNHTRVTQKVQHKDKAATSFDWLLYQMLAKHFEASGDKRVIVLAPPRPDAYFEIYGHRFCLNHGDTIGARGGDGMIGAIGPIMRGDYKMRRTAEGIGQGFDYLLMGHWHTYLSCRNVIVAPSLKGYDEYARDLRLAPDEPKQLLFFVEPELGPIWHSELNLSEPRPASNKPWVTFQKDA